MPVLSPARTQNRSHLADWLELTALTSPTGLVTSAELRRWIGLNSDDDDHGIITDPVTGEPLEREVLEPEVEDMMARVYEELRYRATICGEHYPFEIRQTDSISGNWSRIALRGERSI